MKLHLGPDLSRPTIAATVNSAELCRAQALPEFTEVTGMLTESRGLAVAYDEERQTSDFTFLLRRTCRRPIESHEASLRLVVEFINAFSQCQAEEEAGAAKLRVASLGSSHSPGNGLGLELDVVWPDLPDRVLSELASGVMQGMARNLHYSKKAERAGGYRKRVYAAVDRHGAGSSAGVILHTNPTTGARLDTDGSLYKPDQPNFTLAAHNLCSHKEQLICLAGAMAMAYGDELARA